MHGNRSRPPLDGHAVPHSPDPNRDQYGDRMDIEENAYYRCILIFAKMGNPRWQSSPDPNRHQYGDRMDIEENDHLACPI